MSAPKYQRRPWLLSSSSRIDLAVTVEGCPTPRISCEARLNEDKAILDTYLQDSALRQLHPLVGRPRS
jgi:hypothetical protein